MKLDIPLKRLLMLLPLAACLHLSSCEDEIMNGGEDFMLYYPAISEIAPGTNINIAPTWYGGTPSGFMVSSVMLDGKPGTFSCFSVDEKNGIFSIIGSDELPVGNYTIGISCVVGGRTYDFPEAIAIEMMKPVPDGIIVEPSVISARMTDIVNTGEGIELPTARITTDGSNHVEIKEYLIANVYRDGQLANECREWFGISSSGEFYIVPNNPDFEAGEYVFDFKLVTYIVGSGSEKGIFADALKLQVTSAPTALVYSPASSKVEQGVEGQSVVPTVRGSKEGLTYRLKSVYPDNEVGISIDESTGVLTFPENTSAELGQTYKVSVEVSNDYGSTVFDDVYSFTVIDYIYPITVFSYDDISENISGVSFTNEVKEMDGTEVTYSFVGLPDALSGLVIDAQTGTVTCAKGVELPVGFHSVTVQAKNVKGTCNAEFTINVISNPNYFTYVRWGNNLGEDGEPLQPIEKYGNQFRAVHGSGTLRFEIVDDDIPEDRPVKFTAVKPETASGGISVNANSGRIDVYSKAAGTNKNTLAFTVIEVTVGDGEAAVTRKFPVFADFCGALEGGYQILYTPFAIRCNPKTGGVSGIPEVIDADGNDRSGEVSLDFQTNAQYYNVNGPDSHTNPIMLKNDTDDASFLVNVWKKYYTAINKPYNRGAANPMSYWYNVDNSYLSHTGGYVDADNLQIRVNPEKFVDDEGNYADGAMYMTMTFSPSGSNPQTAADKVQVNRVFIWLDPNYTE